MASIATDQNKNRRILFILGGKRKTLYIGKVNVKHAEAIKTFIDDILAAKVSERRLEPETEKWIASLPESFHSKLVKLELVQARIAVEPRPEHHGILLTGFIRDYIDSRRDVEKGTIRKWLDVEEKMSDYFKGKYLDEITVQDAKNFRIYLKTTVGLAENTARRHIGIARQFYNSAIEAEVVAKNPFRGQPVSIRPNPERFFYVTQDMALKVLDACPDAHWRLVFGLARWGGLRIPSEALALKWQDIDFENEQFTVHSSKTKHHADAGIRTVPMFPELKPLFQDAFDNAPAGAVYCLDRYKGRWSNLGVVMARIIRRAGLDVWPKIFQNCRSTRETELFKITNGNVKAVCSWIGNSPVVAMKHYAQVTEADAKEAAKTSLLNEAKKTTQIPTQHSAETVGNSGKTACSGQEENLIFPTNSHKCLSMQGLSLGGTGLEPVTSCV
jgi:integrase